MPELPRVYLPELRLWEIGGAMEHFTHIDDKGNAVMVDVSGKAVTARTATGTDGSICSPSPTLLQVFPVTCTSMAGERG